MNRRRFLMTSAVGVALAGLPGCAEEGDVPTATVKVLVIAKAAYDGQTVAALKQEAFAGVTFSDYLNAEAKVGWVISTEQIRGKRVVVYDDRDIVQTDFATSEGDGDAVNYETEYPDEQSLTAGEQVAFFLLDCETIAVAKAGETFAELIGDLDPATVVVLRDGQVVERPDLENGVAKRDDELVIFEGKIAA